MQTLGSPYGVNLDYAYDGFLPTSTAWSGVVAGGVSVAYDNNFWVTSQSVNGSDPVSFSYDNDGLLTQAGDLAVTRDPQNGRLIGTSVGAVSEALTYNAFGEISGYEALVSGSPVFTCVYEHDKLGRITKKTEIVEGATHVFEYEYDLAGRLRQVKKDGVVAATYAYDSNGNRLSKTDAVGVVSGVYDAQDRLTQYGAATYAYNNNGELESRTEGSQTTNFDYDVFGNLRRVELPGGDQINYVIDGQNRRVGKKVNGVMVQGFLYQNQLNPVAELDGAGNVVARFVYGSKANVPDLVIKGGVTYRIVSDHLGSPRMVVNTATGAVVQRMAYDEFGEVFEDSNPGFQPFGFAGGLFDRDVGLVRFGARDYDAVTGRWSNKDPLKFVGKAANLYQYVGNDPVNLVDPLGLWQTTIGAGYGIAAQVTFGVNNGQFNLGLGVGFGMGFQLDIGQGGSDPNAVPGVNDPCSPSASLGMNFSGSLGIDDVGAGGGFGVGSRFSNGASGGYMTGSAGVNAIGGAAGVSGTAGVTGNWNTGAYSPVTQGGGDIGNSWGTSAFGFAGFSGGVTFPSSSKKCGCK